MSDRSQSRAADLAAQQVGSILAAAEAAAEEIRAEGRRDAEAERDRGRRHAIELGQEASREAKALIDGARQEAGEIRDQARRAVEGRVAAAGQAATEVLEEARALSNGLRQLGESLRDQGARILRDVQGAHRRMQSDLRVGQDLGVARERPSERREGVVSEPRPRARAGGERRGRVSPLEEFEVPTWVDRG